MKIRLATPDDLDVLARVHIDSWRSAYRGLIPDSYLAALDFTKRREHFRIVLAEHSAEIYVAHRDAEVLGFLVVGPCRDADVDQDRTGEIWGIYLAPEHWRKGVGRLLYRFAERTLQSLGYTLATLWVFSGNAQARRFYEAMGFQADGASKVLEPGAPLEAVRYRKELQSAE